MDGVAPGLERRRADAGRSDCRHAGASVVAIQQQRRSRFRSECSRRFEDSRRQIGNDGSLEREFLAVHGENSVAAAGRTADDALER